MARKKLFRPTEKELDILSILWNDGPSTVRQVNEKMNLQQKTGYTTTLKLMQIMAEKGLADRDTSQRTHIYRPVVTEAETQQNLLTQFVDRTFKGSAMKMVMQALGNHNASEAELDEIKALIEQIESKQQK